MKSTKVLRAAAVTVLGLSLGATVASAAPGSGTIDTTGPNSFNEIVFDQRHRVDLDNDTDVDVDNDTDQDAYTGDAKVYNNTTGGSAESGEALNDNWFSASVTVDNSASSGAALNWAGNGENEGTIDTTGPNSHNAIYFDSRTNIDVNNDTDIDVNNDTDQHASSGDAKVYNNTTGGDATSGDATNVNTTDVTVSISN